MNFSTDYRMSDLAMGLTAVACGPEKDHVRLNSVCAMLGQQTHETVFERAQEIAAEYGAQIHIEQISHADMFVEDMQGFSIGETELGRVCALWGGSDGPIMPPDQSEWAQVCAPPETWTVFRAYSITVN